MAWIADPDFFFSSNIIESFAFTKTTLQRKLIVIQNGVTNKFIKLCQSFNIKSLTILAGLFTIGGAAGEWVTLRYAFSITHKCAHYFIPNVYLISFALNLFLQSTL